MHIPDGILEPSVQAVTGVVAAGAIGFSLWKLRGSLEDRTAPLIGIMAAGIFAGQMVNYPLPLLGVSGHLMGGVLAAAVLGPWGAVVALANVLIVQCFLYADGGPASLGANVFNMGLIGGVIGYAIYDPLRRKIGGPRGAVIASVLASWFVIPLSALAFSIELSWGGQYAFSQVASLMLFYHVFIGIGEAAITGMVVAWIARVRPDLLYGANTVHRPAAHIGRTILAGLAVAASVAVFLAPLASQAEDGLEAVGEESRIGFNTQAVSFPAPFPDYEMPASAEVATEGAGQGGMNWAFLVTGGLGILGSLVTFVMAVGLSHSVQVGAVAERPHAA